MLSTIDRGRRAPIDRSGDRLVTLIAIGLAVAFLAVALVSVALPATIRRGLWLPLHLGLAGGASTAIAGVLPFFVAAFAAAQPAGAALRGASVAAVAIGALGVTIGVIAGAGGVAVAGGLAYVAGLGLVGLATLRPLGGGLGPSRGIVTRAYLVALAMIGMGAILATLLLAGWPPVADAWARLRPGHAWLNLVGFVSLIIAATLVHFFPTVVGARIGTHVSGRVSLLGLGAGPALVAAGYAFGLGVGVQLGAALAILGALALVRYATRIWPTRGRWTTDPDWHRFAIWGLVSAIGWFLCGIVVLGSRTFASGADPSGWSIEPVIGPLLGGWVGLAVVASATHLLPAVGPGDQAAHARQRAILGSLAVPRLVAWNLAVAGISIGLPLSQSGLVLASAIGLAGAFGVTLVLLVRAVWIGLAGTFER